MVLYGEIEYSLLFVLNTERTAMLCTVAEIVSISLGLLFLKCLFFSKILELLILQYLIWQLKGRKGEGGGPRPKYFFTKKSMFFRTMNSFFVLNLPAYFKTYKLQYYLPTQALSERFKFFIEKNSVRN